MFWAVVRPTEVQVAARFADAAGDAGKVANLAAQGQVVSYVPAPAVIERYFQVVVVTRHDVAALEAMAC